MRARKIVLTLFLLIVAIIMSQAFIWNYETDPTGHKTVSNCGPSKISKPNGRESHFFGLNCMSCHKDGRKGDGCFTVAGSVLDEDRSAIHKNPIVKLYSEPNGGGTLMATIQGDALGNFYTTEKIDFSNGLYATLIGSAGAKEPVKHMTRRLIDGMGRCNQCHGFKEEALGID